VWGVGLRHITTVPPLPHDLLVFPSR
jgi:hypothetical protein